MRDLAELRLEIDRIDRHMVELFEQRMAVSEEVAQYKVATGKRILDRERENQKLAAVKAMTHSEFNSCGVAIASAAGNRRLLRRPFYTL